ncbi:MAG: OB-fold nucleic acid binding domain-containing protein [Fimbriimonadaceae bacterium]|nr:OB-fold nucleic acid binding domain-containing protein [Fimbriimonadaceae bacterium]
MGKAGFAHLSDGDAKIQGYFKKDELGETGWELYNLLDIGDHVGVVGHLFLTRTGERSIHVKELVPLSKSLHVLPLGKEKEGQQWYGLSDVEQRYRHRHLDLICNPDARDMLIKRMKITSAVRRYMDALGYLEAETPMLQVVAGGAAARPFLTHYNAYEMDVKLRISLELYLKRLICGDLPKVYEVGRVFRNEGVSNRHSPEFTMLEFYEAYTDLEGMMERVEGLFQHVAQEVFGQTRFVKRVARMHVGPVTVPDGTSEAEALAMERDRRGRDAELDFAQPWKRIDLLTAIEEALHLEPGSLAGCLKLETEGERMAAFQAQVLRGFESLPDAGDKDQLDFDAHPHFKQQVEGGGYRVFTFSGLSYLNPKEETNLGGLIEKLLEALVEDMLQEPTFVVGYPIETSPLAKKDPDNPRLTRRFEGYVLGREMCNAFSELNDPVDQTERFQQQLDERAKGDDEAHPMDEEYVYALESGMPPTGGCGIGIDRMAMALLGADVIREVVLFPTMKPE